MDPDAQWYADHAEFIDDVFGVAESSPAHAGAEIRPEDHALIVFGVGSPDEALVRLMERAPDHVNVVWRAAPYTLRELTDEMDRLLAQPSADRLNSIGPQHDGTGLCVTTTWAELLRAEDPQLFLGSRHPVTVEYGEPAVPIPWETHS